MESTLSLNLSSLRQEVAYFLGKGRNAENWTNEDVDIFDAHIRAGLRMFYNPVGHRWSFFLPVTSLPVPEDSRYVDLPDDFGYIEGNILLSNTNGQSRWPVQRVPVHTMEGLDRERTGAPAFFALESVAHENDTQGQRFRLCFWPVPNDDFVATLKYSVVPHTITTQHPYPYGGEAHAETIREAVLAKAEEDTDDQQGIHFAHYQERLAASVEYDRNLMASENLGYNGDGSDRRFGRGSGVHLTVAGHPIGTGDSGGRWIVYDGR